MSILSRPLQKRLGQAYRWDCRLEMRNHKMGFGYPVFTWGFVLLTGRVIGAIQVKALQGVFFFSENGLKNFQTSDPVKILTKLEELGWGEPPHFDEVWKLIDKTAGAVFSDIELTDQLFTDLFYDWLPFAKLN